MHCQSIISKSKVTGIYPVFTARCQKETWFLKECEAKILKKTKDYQLIRFFVGTPVIIKILTIVSVWVRSRQECIYMEIESQIWFSLTLVVSNVRYTF